MIPDMVAVNPSEKLQLRGLQCNRTEDGKIRYRMQDEIVSDVR